MTEEFMESMRRIHCHIVYLPKQSLPRDKCIYDSEFCEYLTIVSRLDIYGIKHKEWYCSCEDEMCAGCIPTFNAGIYHEKEREETD